MAGASNPQNVQAPNAGGMGGPSASEGRFYSLPPGWQGVREGTPDARRPGTGGMEPPPGQTPMIGFNGFKTPQEAAAAARRQNAPATQPAAQPGGPNVMQTSADLYNKAAAGPNINQFMNPYTRSVVNQSMKDLERQRQMQMNDIGASATQAGAFGGSRHGVAEALTNTGFAQQGADMSANLRQQGFNTALNAAQNQQNIQSGLSQQGFNMGQSISNQQWQQGQAQQNINQQLIDAIKAQYGGFTGAPANGLNMQIGAAGAANMGQGTTTQSQNLGGMDYLSAILSAASMLCWVAREVYGPEDDRWKQFRVWLVGAAPDWLFNAYCKHGEAFAGIVRKAPFLKRVLRPLMDKARRAAGFEV